MREDRSFLREEIREARRNLDDVKNIAERRLGTLKTMAIGRLEAGSLNDRNRAARPSSTRNQTIEAVLSPHPLVHQTRLSSRRYSQRVDHIDITRRNIEIVGADPATRYGFTRVPNFMLTNKHLSASAKMWYAILLNCA